MSIFSISTLTTSSGLTRTAERNAAPAAETARSGKPNGISEEGLVPWGGGCCGCKGSTPSVITTDWDIKQTSLSTFNTLSDCSAVSIHEFSPCFNSSTIFSLNLWINLTWIIARNKRNEYLRPFYSNLICFYNKRRPN